MSKQTITLPYYNGSNATFQNWVGQFLAFLTTVGLTQTADIGQINAATVAVPAAETDGGYSIWRLNDAAATTAPAFLKFRFGTGATAGDSRLVLDIGEGTDGAGNLTGATLLGLTIFHTSYSSTPSMTIQVLMNWNPTNGYFGLCTMNAAGASPQNFFTLSMERLRTALGAPSTRGFAVVYTPGTTIPYYSTFRPGSFSSESGPSIPAFWPWQNSGCSSAGGTFISGLTPNTGDGTHGPLEKTLGFCVVGSGDFSIGAQFSVTRWDGTIHNYVCTVTTGASNQSSGNNPTNYTRHAIWWD